MKLFAPVLVIAAMMGVFIDPLAHATSALGQSPPDTAWSAPLDEAHHMFYSGCYEEARRSLETVLERRPDHIRAQVALAWIDYIVATRLPPGTRWLLGGGNKDRGLRTVEDAAQADTTRFVRAEAMFALWDMRAREENFAEAVVTARVLSHDFPENRELVRFVARHEEEDE